MKTWQTYSARISVKKEKMIMICSYKLEIFFKTLRSGFASSIYYGQEVVVNIVTLLTSL